MGHYYAGSQPLPSSKLFAKIKALSSTIKALTTEQDKHEQQTHVLNAKIDAVDANLSKKIDAVSTDLKAHRADTEAHHGIYLLKES